ncbi:MAG: lysophospholipid acyltransferase family protein [Planctomycetota bacterium]
MATRPAWPRLLLWLGDLHRRMLPVYFALIGPRAAYALLRRAGRVMYRLLPPLRERSEAQLAAALAGRMPSERIPDLAARAWDQRIWNLADLLLSQRLLHPGTYARVGGRVPEPHLTDMLDAQRRRQPAILVSAYYGPYDLLPLLLGYNGIRASAVYLRHASPTFDMQRSVLRARSGCELVPVERALERLPQVLAAGGTIAIVADHYAEKHGVPITFLGRPTMALRTVGLLAWRYGADVVVAGIRRVGVFRFQIVVEEVLKEPDWAHAPDPIAHITQRYTRALETMILRDPTQYLWLRERWGPLPAGSSPR